MHLIEFQYPDNIILFNGSSQQYSIRKTHQIQILKTQRVKTGTRTNTNRRKSDD